METPASVKKHPLHPILIAFPIGLWGFSLICDLLSLVLQDVTPAVVAFYTLAGGLAGALIAAVPGVIDMLSLRNANTRRIALIHMAINIVVVIMYAVNLGLRMPDITATPPGAIALSGVSILLLGVSGWLGGELVHVRGVSVANAHGPESAATQSANQQRNSEKRTSG